MRSVIEMAREAGIEFTYDPTETPVRAFVECWEDELEKFADLVRADDREQIKKANAPEIEKVNAHIKSFEAAVADEREVCAEDADWCIQNHLEHLIPERIRARGNK